jgi:hypothetical protein
VCKLSSWDGCEAGASTVALEVDKFAYDLKGYEPRVVRLGQAFVLPVAAPAWLIERLASRSGRSWQFGLLSSIPYFIAMTGAATYLVVMMTSQLLALFGLALLIVLEFVALATAISVGLGVGRETRFQVLCSAIMRRRPRTGIRTTLDAVVASVIALCYTTWFFSVWFFYLYQHHPGQVGGITSDASPLAAFWATFYLSATTITTGQSEYVAIGGIAQFLSLVEIVVGLIFFIFVLATVVARLSRLAPQTQRSGDVS